VNQRYRQFININFGEFDISELGGHSMNRRLHELARPTPRRRKIHYQLHNVTNLIRSLQIQGNLKHTAKKLRVWDWGYQFVGIFAGIEVKLPTIG